MGGVNLRLFASEHLDELAGMVLVDAVTDEQPAKYWALLSDAELNEYRAGLLKLHEGIDYDTFVAGISDMRASSRSIGDKPLVVLTRGKEEAPPGAPPERAGRLLHVWHEMQAELSHLSTNAVQVVVTQSGHFIQWDAPRLVTASIVEVVNASRAHRRVTEKSLTPIAGESAP
jgi:pimeloyl-ACP methyl ester carboxylesterase